MNSDSREQRATGDNDEGDDFTLRWAQAKDRWTEVVEDKGDFLVGDESGEPLAPAATGEDLPWGTKAEADTPAFLLSDPAEPDVDDEMPPHGDPLEETVEAEAFSAGAGAGAGSGGGAGGGARMGNLQDALASIRERVQSLSSDMPGPGRQGAAAASQLALYRAATDDRTLSELRRHGTETENLLRRLAANLQDLSTDLRSIVDAARRAIDQTSEQAESSIELGRLLGERIEQMDADTTRRLDDINGEFSKRFTKLEQRAGVGVVREELAELRSDFSELRNELAVVTEGGGSDLASRIDVVGAQLDNTMSMLRDLIEGAPGQEGELGDMVDGVVASIRTETEAAVEPFRAEVEELGRQLSESLDREEQLGTTLAELTAEVTRLRKRIAVRAAPPTIDDEQIQDIVDAVVAATSAKRTTAPSKAAPRRRPVRAPEPDFEDDLDVEDEPEEPEPEEAPKRPLRARPIRAARKTKKAPAPEPEDEEPEYEVDINQPFEPGELDLADAALDVEPDEEPIRRARGTRTTKRAERPLKGRRSRSSK